MTYKDCPGSETPFLVCFLILQAEHSALSTVDYLIAGSVMYKLHKCNRSGQESIQPPTTEIVAQTDEISQPTPQQT